MNKKIISMFLVIASTTMLSACGGSSADSDETELPEATTKVNADTPSWKNDDKEADLDWYVNFSWFAQKWGEDVATKYISEDTHVNVTYMNGDDDKFNTMLASGDLPDIITIDSTSNFIGDAAKFAYPLDELSEKYDPYFMEHAAKKDTLKYFTTDDGHIYGYPSYSTTDADYEEGGLFGNQSFMVRKDIYEKIGSPDMSTPEGFLSALEKVKELNEKDIAGKAVIPLGMSPFTSGSEKNSIFDNTLADFLGIPVETENHQFNDRYNNKDYMSWVKTLAEANREGFTDPDMISMTVDDKDTRLSNGGYFAYFCSDVTAEQRPLTVWKDQSNEGQYIPIDGPSSLEGNKPLLKGPSIFGWTLTFISKDCKNPEKAMELFTYLTSEEGDTVMNYGREGETYTMVDGTPKLNEDLLKLKQSDPSKFETEVGLMSHPWFQDSARLNRQLGVSRFTEAIQPMMGWTTDKLTPEIGGYDDTLSKSEKRDLEKINQQWATTVVEMLKANSNDEVDSLMKDFEEYKEKNGYSEIEKKRDDQLAKTAERMK